MQALTQRFDGICERMEKAASRAGRNPASVRLVAVSKTHPAEAVAALAKYWAGSGFCNAPAFGESYMQEAREKIPAVRALLGNNFPAPLWHFVGHVQTRKARDLAGNFHLIHSVDSPKLAVALQKAWQSRVAARPLGADEAPPPPQAVLVQVNIGREPQKSGVDPDRLDELVAAIASIPELSLRGLMCLPPLAEIGDASRPYFAMLRELRDKAQKHTGLELPHLSMGMSDDFEAAIEEGATLVRIGTDIFGSRT